MNELTLKTIAIAGLCLQFAAFWLAAPEILGAEWLIKTKNILKKIISQIPNYLLILCGSVFGAVIAQSRGNYLILALVVIVLIIVTIFQKRISKYLEIKLSEPLISKLIVNNQLRFTLLKLATWFFTIGFVLQLIAIIWG